MHNITSEQDVSHFILYVNFQKKEYGIKRQIDKNTGDKGKAEQEIWEGEEDCKSGQNIFYAY